jgi:uncharacterized integral membrane protein
MSQATPPQEPTGAKAPRRTNKENGRLIAAGTIGGLVVAFALLNTNEVQVNWLVSKQQTPLIVVIAVAFVVGLAFGFGYSKMSARRSAKRPK